MTRPRLRLHYRIVIPFAALVALSLISRTLRSRVQARTLSTSQAVSRSEFALNPMILRSVKDITGADVVTYDSSGTVLASTFESAHAAVVGTVVSSDQARQALSQSGADAITRELSCEGIPCYAVYRRLSA